MSLAALAALLVLAMPQPNLEAKVDVVIEEPSGFEAVFGEVEVKVEVFTDREVARVELLVDGRSAGTRDEPPWRFRVDVGQDNVEHRFQAVATDVLGITGKATVVTPRIRVDEEVDVELQQLYVTVTRDDRRVLDLGEGDFQVSDDGRRERLVTFARGDVSITAVLLLDSSVSMAGDPLRAGLRGAEAFISGMKELDEAMLMLFSDQLIHVTPFTNHTTDLLEPLEGLEAGGNTAINDHLYLAMKLLDARQGRRVVVLFTDGADLHSVLSMEDVVWKARRSQALIYWLLLGDAKDQGGFATAWRNAEGNAAEFDLLVESVEQSGGRITYLDSVAQVEPAFREILAELREQYVLGYYPSRSENDGSWHEVKVDVKRSGLKVRTRGGYVDF